ncbi:MAG TPA: TonB-dependent receptor [Flavisolibacter sp.]|nr:TonB-dependent receptor [Flavisolibacter sp.]
MKKFLLAILMISSISSLFAQNKPGSISGSVIDGSRKTIESATIALCKAKDSAVVKYSVADKDGRFLFENIKEGEYFVSVTAVGHQKGYSEKVSFSSSSTEVHLKTIELIPDAKTMSAVTVTGRKPFIEQKADKMIVNVDAAVSNVGASALEVLEKTPGVTVDKDGNISLKGKQGVTVMIDGRPAYLSGTDLTNYLKGLPATAIDQIEIMTNPSAKYDAAGNSGIINIKSKKNKQVGFNGSVTSGYSQGIYWKSNNSLNLNYRTGKFNFFLNGNLSQWNGYQELEILRKFKDQATGDINAIFSQNTQMKNRNTFNNVKIGADYYVSKKTTVGVVLNGFTNPQLFTSKSTSYLEDNKGTVDSIVYAESRNNNNWKNGSVNLNFRTQFDSTGKELTTDFDYVSYRSTGTQAFINTVYNPDWTMKHADQLASNIPVNVDIYSAKLDYSLPLKKEAKLEAGLKSSYVKTNNAADYFIVSNLGETVDYSKTNHFLYNENIDAAYLNYNKQFKKFGIQAGLRYEFTSYDGKQFGNPTRKDSSFKNSYGSFFPTAYFSYTADKNNQLALSFGRRIDRPAYQDLNPFMFFLDEYTYEAGNPFLKPQFTNNIELSHTFKGFLITTLNYSHTKDYMNETFQQAVDVNGKQGYATIVSRGNIGIKDGAGISVSAQLHVKKWWMAMLYGNYNYNRFYGAINNGTELVDVSASNIVFNANNQFTFSKGWGAEISGWYRTKGVDGQIIIQPMGAVNAGISKQILKTKGSIKLNVRDIFLTQLPVGDITFGNTLAHFTNKHDSRVASLSFTYRFGKPLKDVRQRKAGGADDEQNRVKVGNGN